MARLATALVAVALVLAAVACGSTTPRKVPDVTGKRLDVAEDTLDVLGLRYRTAGGGVFGIVVRSRWVVCGQAPRPRTPATTVVLTVARSCTVPFVVGETLDDAREQLEDAGLDVHVHSLDGGPVIADSLWAVCRQSPAAGAPAPAVDLHVSHDCRWRVL